VRALPEENGFDPAPAFFPPDHPSAESSSLENGFVDGANGLLLGPDSVPTPPVVPRLFGALEREAEVDRVPDAVDVALAE